MSRIGSGTPYYTLGYKEEYIEYLNRREVTTHAAHLLPYLKPGLRVLDFGCGPGTLTLGLAELVKPGEVHGIDMEESQIDMARSSAEEGGHDNALFRVADVTDLPFDDDSFDVAHCHSVLMFVPDTLAALTEVKRVLKPGGIISSRETIIESSFLRPDLYSLNDIWLIYSNMVMFDDGHPEMGKDLKGHLTEAGFTDIQASASFNSFSTTEEVRFFRDFARGWFLSEPLMETAIDFGATTEKQSADVRRALEQWVGRPGAFGAIAYGEALAFKP